MSNPYKVAEAKIASALAELEQATGAWVEGVEIHSVEVTRMGDDRQQLARRVHVMVRERPGSGWWQQEDAP